MIPFRAWLLIAAVFFAANHVSAWDPTGHMLVGEIAWSRAKPATREKVSALAAKLDTRFTQGRAYNFTTAGCWMDDMRAMKNYPWSPLHYVTVAYTTTGTAFTEPPPPHILSAMDEKIALLREPTRTEAERAEAVGMLIHFVGDLHQPMHVTDWDDRGGNGYLIFGIPFSDLMKRQIANLHTFWDKAFRFDERAGKIVEIFSAPLLEQRPEPGAEGIIREEAARIRAESPSESLPPAREMDYRKWARESHTIGCLFAYPSRPHPRDTGAATLDPYYVKKARAIAAERIALAGYRLASLLDSLFAP
jgi:hypothetical protein